MAENRPNHFGVVNLTRVEPVRRCTSPSARYSPTRTRRPQWGAILVNGERTLQWAGARLCTLSGGRTFGLLMRVAAASAVLGGVLAALASNQALAERPKVAVSAEAKAVVEGFVKGAGARSALACVSAGRRAYTFSAGAGSPRTGDDRFRVGSSRRRSSR